MCIIKEINMLELTASDRQMALNEVKIMAKMDHPNIIAFHDSFEKDGVLMIEMEYADGGNLAEFLSKRKTCVFELCLSAASAAKFNIAPVRWQHPSHVAIVPTESKGKTEGNNWDTACGYFKT
jgi:serine/threonine protein kinase